MFVWFVGYRENEPKKRGRRANSQRMPAQGERVPRRPVPSSAQVGHASGRIYTPIPKEDIFALTATPARASYKDVI